MKKRIYSLMSLLFIIISVFSQTLPVLLNYGTYKHYAHHRMESFELLPNGEFRYLRVHPGYDSISGYWVQKDSLLILNSIPQRDRVVIYEGYVKSNKRNEIKVVNKSSIPLFFKLNVITTSNDTLNLDGIYTAYIPAPIKSFRLINAALGLGVAEEPRYDYPSYQVRYKECNYFVIIFETDRIFEHEEWIIKNDKEIKPILENGKEAYYTLKKE